MMLEASASEVRQALTDLGDLVECDDQDCWRVIRDIAPDRILSPDERSEREQLERTVEQAFYIAGTSLKALRDKRLYRETHATFAEYCRDRFDFTRRAADYLILAAEVVENLKREQIVLKTNVLPTKESQCRALSGKSPKVQTQAWIRAVEIAGGKKVPSAKVVKQAIKEIESVDSKGSYEEEIQPSFREVSYQAGLGVEYTVKLDERTFFRLKAYQDKIGTATKSGAIARLLDEIAE